MRIHRPTVTSFVLLTPLLLSVLVRPADATQVVTTCGTTCTSDCQLGNNLVCGTGQSGVTLANGADLDFKGFSIFCNATLGNLCDVAVKMLSAGSVVGTTVLLNPKSAIAGAWAHAVDCQGQANSVVSGLQIRGFWSESAINSCSSVVSNVIEGVPDTGSFFNTDDSGYFFVWPPVCVNQSPISFTDSVTQNHIAGCNIAIRRTSGGMVGTVDKNNVECHDDPPIYPAYACIEVNGAALLSKNILTGDSAKVINSQGQTNVTYDSNICKFGMPGCGACVSQGKCVASATTTSP